MIIMLLKLWTVVLCQVVIKIHKLVRLVGEIMYYDLVVKLLINNL